jgi:hypothetical protein
VAETRTGTAWFIEGDISRCFDRLDDQVMVETLGEKIRDNRLLRLIGQMLRAGEPGGPGVECHAQRHAARPGSLPAPVEHLPGSVGPFRRKSSDAGYTAGGLRARNPEYRKLQNALAQAPRCGDHAVVWALCKQQRCLPSRILTIPFTDGWLRAISR